MPAHPIDTDAPLFVVLNATSGRHDAAEIRATVEQAAGPQASRLRWHVIERARQVRPTAWHAAAQAARHGGMIVAAGGDGTINSVAQAAHTNGCPMGVLPLGTFNYFSRAHDIPQDPAEAVRVLLAPTVQPVQVAVVNDHLFLVNASVGLYPQLLEDREAYKSQYGRSRAVALVSALVTLLRHQRQLRLQIEHAGGTRQVRTPTLFVGNNRLQLEQVGIPQASALDEGRVAAVMLRPVGTLTMLGLILRGALGSLGDADSVESFEFQRITVRTWSPYSGRQVKVATDGEVTWMRSPLEFRVAAMPLYLAKPLAASASQEAASVTPERAP